MTKKALTRFSGRLSLLLMLCWPAPGWSGPPLTVAVATNFRPSLERVLQDYRRQGGPEVILISGSSGSLHTQIRNGAPFDLFFSADEARPRDLQDAGLVAPGQMHVYALGQLALYGPRLQAQSWQQALQLADRIAMPNPRHAPYGQAAQQFLQTQQISLSAQTTLVQAGNVQQSFRYAATGQVQLAFVALAQLGGRGLEQANQYWLLPEHSYAPIRQTVVALRGSAQPEQAAVLIQHVLSAPVQAWLVAEGYKVLPRR